MKLTPRTSRIGPPAAGYAGAVAGVGLTSALIHFVPGAERIDNVSMLYLLAVIGTAVGSGSGPAVTASFLAVLAFNWFFVEPRVSFELPHDLWDTVCKSALSAYLWAKCLTGVVCRRVCRFSG